MEAKAHYGGPASDANHSDDAVGYGEDTLLNGAKKRLHRGGEGEDDGGDKEDDKVSQRMLSQVRWFIM